MGGIFLFPGELPAARTSLEQAIVLYDAQRHHAYAVMHGVDPGVCASAISPLPCGCWAIQTRRCSGASDAGPRPKLGHPYSLVFGLTWVTMLHQVRGEGAATQELAETLINLCTEQGVSYW